jgi:hypothetical protein
MYRRVLLFGEAQMDQRQNNTLIYIGIFAVFFIFLVFSFAVSNFGISEKYGDFGSFLGGVLGPILSFFGLLGLLYTIKLQQEELSLTRDEMKRSANALEFQHKEMQKQSFENTFFRMLEFHAATVAHLHIVTSYVARRHGEFQSVKDEYNGQDCFNFLHEMLMRKIRECLSLNKISQPTDDVIDISYKNYWNDGGQNLAHYYRSLYNIIKIADLNSENPSFYVKILRSQLTDGEIALLYYNSRYILGVDFEKYIKKYNLLDNIRNDLIFSIKENDSPNVSCIS